MDNLLLFIPDKKSPNGKLEDLLKAWVTQFSKVKKVCVRPMRMRIEANQRLNPSTTPKG